MVLEQLSIQDIGRWLTVGVTGASLLRAVLVKAEPGIEIWKEKNSASKFWRTYEKVIQTLAFLSISPNRADERILPKVGDVRYPSEPLLIDPDAVKRAQDEIR